MLADECELLEQDCQWRVPGIKANDNGLTFHHRAVETMRNWKP
jgi:hypothetical protein